MTKYYSQGWLPSAFNDFFDNAYMTRANATAPSINVAEDKEQYTVELAAPGMTKEDFNIHLDVNGDLVIEMEKKANETEEKKERKYLRREFSYVKFQQTLVLPDNVDKSKIAAGVKDGILTIDLPKVNEEEVKLARKIEVM
ncbi:MAG: Hsp20/alpha crystallin family protein [Bacteroidales bacterium]|nr:Hsp20/alpha crystallin family protein [Bacteroidales bacterium]